MGIAMKNALVLAALCLAACSRAENTTISQNTGAVHKQAGEQKQQELIASLPENSAIKKAIVAEQVELEQRQRATIENRARLEKRNAAEKIGETLKLQYMNTSYEEPDNYISSGLLRFWDRQSDDDHFQAIMLAYPHCGDRNRVQRYIMLDCIYASFVLEHVAPDQEILRAFALARNAGIQIILTHSPFRSSPGTISTFMGKKIYMSVLADNKTITDYLMKDAQK